MRQNATATFDGRTNLEVAGELLPVNPGEHDALAALLDEKNPPEVSVEFKNTGNVLSYTLKFSRPAPVTDEA